MIIYGYIWMGVALVLFLVCLYAAYSRGLLRAGPLVALAVAGGAGFALRAMTYMQFLRIMSFHELKSPGMMLGATAFGVALLIAYVFVLLAIISLLVSLLAPLGLGGGDVFVLACLCGFGVSLVNMLYGIGALALHQLL